MFLLGIVAGTAVVQQLAALPPADGWLAWGLALALCVAVLAGRRRGAACCVAAGCLGAGLGVAWAAWQAQARLDDGLAAAHHDVVSRLVLRIADLPQGDGGQWRFLADTGTDRPVGVPARVAVSWHALPGARLPDIKPGQVWRMALVLRHPHGARNPQGYDAEGRLFALGIRATATVRGVPRLLRDEPWANAEVVIERLRHRMRAGMRQALGERRYAPVLIALAIGDQAGVAREDWQVFNRSGITHLVSISGLHVTLIAGLGGMLAAWLWRRARWRGLALPERLPAQVAGSAGALLVALSYCLVAGWGVPARRTFFMLAVVALAAMVRLPLSPSRILLLAAAAVTLFDPWASLAAGFWLSFGAVAILLRAAASTAVARPAHRPSWRARLEALLAEFGRVQAAVTLGLVPLLAALVQQVSLGSPLANAIAIPVVSLLVTPLALLCAACGVLPGLGWLARIAGMAGHLVFDWTMVPVVWIGVSRWAALDVAAAPWPLLVLALGGVAWALQPPGWPVRAAGWLLMLPMLCWRPERPAPGYWTITALDVGQGGAIVIETASQAWLFDTGPRQGEAVDAGARVVAPFLRARGHRRLDGLVVSHADLDHAGGLQGALAALPVAQAYASFDLPAFLLRRARIAGPAGAGGALRLPASTRPCHAGQAWQVDGVAFRFLHPAAPADGQRASGNARSCVLLLQGRAHAALLPGDVGVAQERRFAAGLPGVDVVLAPHHGSATSSSPALVRAARASHVIAQAGYLNRFRHPAPQVQARWQQAGAVFWRTDQHGAVVAASGPAGLRVWSVGLAARRYWHRPPP